MRLIHDGQGHLSHPKDHQTPAGQEGDEVDQKVRTEGPEEGLVVRIEEDEAEVEVAQKVLTEDVNVVGGQLIYELVNIILM